MVKQKIVYISVEDGLLTLWDDPGEGRAEALVEVTPFSISMGWYSVVPDMSDPGTKAQVAVFEQLIPD